MTRYTSWTPRVTPGWRWAGWRLEQQDMPSVPSTSLRWHSFVTEHEGTVECSVFTTIFTQIVFLSANSIIITYSTYNIVDIDIQV